MENEKLDIQVGDRVTYKYEDDDIIRVAIVSDMYKLKDYINMATTSGEPSSIKIIKIERPHYEVVEEKKELLTDEEKEFLKAICKYYNIRTIYFSKFDIGFYNEHNYLVNALDYPENMEFNKVKKEKYCTLEELGLEEQ